MRKESVPRPVAILGLPTIKKESSGWAFAAVAVLSVVLVYGGSVASLVGWPSSKLIWFAAAIVGLNASVVVWLAIRSICRRWIWPRLRS